MKEQGKGIFDMSWFEKLIPSRIRTDATTEKKKKFPEGLWHKCPSCNAVLYRADLERNLEVCPKCDFHERVGGRKRLDMFLDKENRVEIGENIAPVDMLRFKDSKKYKDRISEAQKATNEKDALIVMSGQIHGVEVVVACFDFRFMGGSMGSVVGERFVRKVRMKPYAKKYLIMCSLPVEVHVCKKLYSH